MEIFESEIAAEKYFEKELQIKLEELRKNISDVETYEIEKTDELLGTLCRQNHEGSRIVKYGIRKYYPAMIAGVRQEIGIIHDSQVITCICKKCYEENNDSQAFFFD